MPDFSDPVVLMATGVIIIVATVILAGGSIIGMVRGFLNGNMSSAANGLIGLILTMAGLVIGFVIFVLGLVLALLPKSVS